MLNIMTVNIPISVTATTNLSSVIQLEKGKRVVAIEFTTPDYTNSVSTTVSVMSAAGRSLASVASIGKNTAKTKIFDTDEQAPIFGGAYLKAFLSNPAGGATAYSMDVILYLEDSVSGAISIPTGMVTAMSFATQPDAVIDQASPVQNTWYTIVEAQNTKVFGIALQVDTTTETLECRVTADGEVFTGSASCTNDTKYKATVQTWPTGGVMVITSSILVNSNELEARDLKVEVRKTSANGTGNLKACVSYVSRG